MGWLKRLGQVVTGLGGAAQAPFGLAKDLAGSAMGNLAPTDWNDFVAESWRATKKRGGQFISSAIGPTEGLGAAIGGLPEGFGPRPLVREATEDLEFLWREGVSEPITTALTVGSLADAPGGGGIGGLLDPDKWREGYRVAQNRSPGQALALAAGTKDISNLDEVSKFQETGAYQWVSGATDAVLRWTVDPTVIGGKLMKVGRERFLVRPITGNAARDRTIAVLTRLEEGDEAVRATSTLQKIDQAMVARRLRKFAKEAEGMDAAQIRHRFFPNHEAGAFIASVLGEAENVDDIYRRLKVLVGDPDALAAVRGQSDALASQMERLVNDQIDLRKFGEEGSLFFRADDEARLFSEVDELYAAQESLELKTLAAGAMREVPRASLTGRMRSGISSSEVYQTKWYAAPLRRAFRMQHQLVNLHDPRSDIQVGRFLEHSTLDLEERNLLRSEYMTKTNDTDRLGAALKIENRAVAKIAEDAGLTKDQLDTLLANKDRTRMGVNQILRGRKYDGMQRSVVRFADDGGVTEVPLWVSQNANVVPLVDIEAVKKATQPIKRYLERHNVPGVEGLTSAGSAAKTALMDIPADFLDSFYKVWRPSVLLRGAWPIRVVGDEQLRIIAKIGAVNLALSDVRAIKGMGGLRAAREAAEEGAGVGGRVAAALKSSPDDFTYRGHVFEGPYGHPGDADNAYRELARSRAAFDALGGRQYGGILEELRDAAQTGEWGSLTAEHANYGNAWLRAVNDQIGSDVMGRKLLAGESVDDVVAWMTSTTEGVAYAKRSVRGKRMKPDVIRRWVEDAQDQVDAYTAGSVEIREAAMRGKATTEMLENWVPDPALRPTVHGEILNQSMGKGAVEKVWNRITDAGYKALGSLPSDALSRNRFFDHMYRAEVKRLVNITDDIDAAAVKQIESKARQYALNETQDLLYNLAEQSDLAGTLRFVTPFLSAWGEVLSRWAGLAVENPAFVARARQVWLSPERAGMVVDEKGNTITQEGAFDAQGNKVEAGTERMVLIPQPLADLMPGVRKGQPVKFNKASLNMVLSGWPGFGPPVTVPLNEIAKDRPDLEKVVRFALPMGTTQEIRTLIMPTLARNIATRAAGEDDRVFALSKMRIFNDMWVDYNLGKSTEPPTEAEAQRRAEAFWSAKTVASFMSPVSLQFASPYQTYIDAFRQARERLAEDPLALADEYGNERTADEWFLDTFGEEFFPLTQSFSKSLNGVPPTLEAWKASAKYKDLLEEFPEYGSLILGREGAGEFAGAVYDYQFSHKLGPGQSENQRVMPDFAAASVQPDVRIGWIKYTRAMDIIEHERIARGLPNLQVKKARDLRELKKNVIAGIAREHQSWWEEFNQRDDLKWDKRISALTELAEDGRLAGRSEFRVLREYLDARQVILEELSRRKAKTLTAKANQDLVKLWDNVTGALVEKDLAFSDLFYRYLDRDPIREPILPVEVAA